MIKRSATRPAAGSIVVATMLGTVAAAVQAQATDHMMRTHVRPLDGVNLFVAPHASTTVRGLRLGGQVELGRGRFSAWSGSGSIGWESRSGLRLTATARRGSATARQTDRADRSLGVALDGDRAGLSAAFFTVDTNAGQNTAELRGTEIRIWSRIANLFELGMSMRRATVAEQGEAVDQRHYVVGGYEFVATSRRNFVYVADRRDLEAEITATIGGFRVTGVVGRALADQLMPARTWAWGRLAVPLPHGLEVLAEAGRNQDGGLVARPPGGFARIGLRLDVGAARTNRTTAPPLPPGIAAAAATVDVSDGEPRLIVHSRVAEGVEVMGDFTAWQPRAMEQNADGEWSFPVRTGVLRFNIRIDGGPWTVPAGVSIVADEFSGAPVAVIVVRQ
jgi:hypothetical protein